MFKIIFPVLIITTFFLVSTTVSAQTYSQEEYAVYNRCEFIAPGSVCDEPQKPEPSFFERLGSFLTSFFFVSPENPKKLEDQSKAKQKSLVPKEITNNNPEYEQSVENTILKEEGIYGYTMPPTVISGFKEGRQTECAFNNANFPNGISVFTDDANCPTTGQ